MYLLKIDSSKNILQPFNLVFIRQYKLSKVNKKPFLVYFFYLIEKVTMNLGYYFLFQPFKTIKGLKLNKFTRPPTILLKNKTKLIHENIYKRPKRNFYWLKNKTKLIHKNIYKRPKRNFYRLKTKIKFINNLSEQIFNLAKKIRTPRVISSQ